MCWACRAVPLPTQLSQKQRPKEPKFMGSKDQALSQTSSDALSFPKLTVAVGLPEHLCGIHLCRNCLSKLLARGS